MSSRDLFKLHNVLNSLYVSLVSAFCIHCNLDPTQTFNNKPAHLKSLGPKPLTLSLRNLSPKPEDPTPKHSTP